jgi:acetyltransferase-like isoleucine patch superfamily enzyme
MDFSKIRKGIRNPIQGFRVLSYLLRGLYYKVKYRIQLNDRVNIGKNFMVKRRFSIKGSGRVTIGDNVFADGTMHTVTPWTTHIDAEIIIGNNVFLNGTRFGCRRRITIGNNCILADCRILDTDYHSIIPTLRNHPEAVRSAPIQIGNNVWIAMGCVILRGVTIGDNSTISAVSVVYNDVPEYTVYGGNPATFIKKVPRYSNLSTEL